MIRGGWGLLGAGVVVTNYLLYTKWSWIPHGKDICTVMEYRSGYYSVLTVHSTSHVTGIGGVTDVRTYLGTPYQFRSYLVPLSRGMTLGR
jgi:hypothetical protein